MAGLAIAVKTAWRIAAEGRIIFTEAKITFSIL
jgi:hypothetical protein